MEMRNKLQWAHAELDAGGPKLRRWIAFSIFVFWAGVSIGQHTTEQQILKLSSDKFRWLTSAKTDSLQLVLDERVRYIHSNGWIQNREEVLADLKSGKLVYEAIEVKTAEARMYPNTAIVTGTGKFTVLMSGNPLVIDLSYTEVYVKKGKTWWLASRHANRMIP